MARFTIGAQNSASRQVGAKELKKIYHRLHTCSTSEFLEEWSAWFDELSEAEKYATCVHQKLAEARALLLADLLCVSADFPSVRRMIGSQVGPLLSQLMLLESPRGDVVLYVLQSLLISYSRACARLYDEMTSFVFAKFSSRAREVRRETARTLALMPRCKLVKKDKNPCTAWNAQMRIIIATVHRLALMLTVSEHDTAKCVLSLADTECLAPAMLPRDFKGLCRIVEGLLWTTVDMLSMKFPAKVEVPTVYIQRLFTCMCDLFWSRPSVCSESILAFLQPSFLMVNQTVRLLKVEFAPFCAATYDLLFSLLYCSVPADKEYGFFIRRCVYDTLSVIIRSLGARSKLHCRFKQLMPVAKKELGALTKTKARVIVRVSERNPKRKAKAADDSLDHSVQKCMSLPYLIDAAVGCCDLLDEAMLSFSNLLDSSHFRALQQFMCLMMIEFCNSEKWLRMFPWKVPAMRCALYRLLARFIHVVNRGCPSPIDWCHTVFTTGQRDACPDVIRICQDVYSLCQRISKPTVPYSLPIQYEKTDFDPLRACFTANGALNPDLDGTVAKPFLDQAVRIDVLESLQDNSRSELITTSVKNSEDNTVMRKKDEATAEQHELGTYESDPHQGLAVTSSSNLPHHGQKVIPSTAPLKNGVRSRDTSSPNRNHDVQLMHGDDEGTFELVASQENNSNSSLPKPSQEDSIQTQQSEDIFTPSVSPQKEAASSEASGAIISFEAQAEDQSQVDVEKLDESVEQSVFDLLNEFVNAPPDSD